MKHITVKILLYALTSLAGLQFTSCLKDDLSDCDGGDCVVSLRFEYTHHTEDGDMFAELVDDVDVYVFDQYDNYVYNFPAVRNSLKGGNTMTIKLPEGRYRFVTWGNVSYPNYDIIPAQQSRGGYLMQVSGNGNDVADLFYGISQIDVSEKRQDEVMPLIRNTHIVRVYISGLPPTRNIPGTDYSVRILGSNAIYDFENIPVATSPATYIPVYSTLTHGNEHYKLSEFKVQRLYVGDDVTVQIKLGDAVKLNDSLTERIIAEYGGISGTDDLDRQYEYDIYYRLTEDGVFLFAGINIVDWGGPSIPGDL